MALQADYLELRVAGASRAGGGASPASAAAAEALRSSLEERTRGLLASAERLGGGNSAAHGRSGDASRRLVLAEAVTAHLEGAVATKEKALTAAAARHAALEDELHEERRRTRSAQEEATRHLRRLEVVEADLAKVQLAASPPPRGVASLTPVPAAPGTATTEAEMNELRLRAERAEADAAGSAAALDRILAELDAAKADTAAGAAVGSATAAAAAQTEAERLRAELRRAEKALAEERAGRARDAAVAKRQSEQLATQLAAAAARNARRLPPPTSPTPAPEPKSEPQRRVVFAASPGPSAAQPQAEQGAPDPNDETWRGKLRVSEYKRGQLQRRLEATQAEVVLLAEAVERSRGNGTAAGDGPPLLLAGSEQHAQAHDGGPGPGYGVPTRLTLLASALARELADARSLAELNGKLGEAAAPYKAKTWRRFADDLARLAADATDVAASASPTPQLPAPPSPAPAASPAPAPTPPSRRSQPASPAKSHEGLMRDVKADLERAKNERVALKRQLEAVKAEAGLVSKAAPIAGPSVD